MSVQKCIRSKPKKRFSKRRFASIAAALFIVVYFGANAYAYTNGLPNIFTTIYSFFNQIDNENFQEVNITQIGDNLETTLKRIAYDNKFLLAEFEVTALEESPYYNNFDWEIKKNAYMWNSFFDQCEVSLLDRGALYDNRMRVMTEQFEETKDLNKKILRQI